MPIKVYCPNGCVIRMPSNRAGKVVRCPECKAVIRLDRKSFAGSAQPEGDKKVKAQLHKLKKTLDDAEVGKTSDPNSPLTENRPAAKLEIPKPVIERHSKSKSDQPSVPNNPIVVDDRQRSRKEKTANEQVRLNVPAPKTTEEPIEIELGRPDPIIFSQNGNVDEDEPIDEKTKLRKKAKTARLDRLTLARFFAACLCVAALVNLGPAIYYWVQWSQAVDGQALPRWIYLQVFVAAIHFVYAIYLVQVPDWSSLRSVGFAMLGFAVVFGIVSTGLVVGGGEGIVSQFLELPFVIAYKATIWCVAMLVLSTLLCFVIGREAANWQRTEQLLEQILSGKSATGA